MLTLRKRILLLALLAGALLAVSCASDSVDGFDEQTFGHLTAEETRELIDQGVDPRDTPGARSFGGLTDEQIDQELAVVLAERERERNTADALADEELSNWSEAVCPAGGSTEDAFFDPQPLDGRPIDIDPGEGWRGYQIVRVADIVLPDGVLQESGGAKMGDGSAPVNVAQGGTYPFFMALADLGNWSPPALGQLVLDPTSDPVRWEDDERFGFATTGGEGWIGSPEAAEQPARDALFDVLAYRDRPEEHICYSWQRDTGANFVRYFNGWGDGFFPGAAGYDADDNLVAITWFFGHAPWMLAGIPGTPPAEVLARLSPSPTSPSEVLLQAQDAWRAQDWDRFARYSTEDVLTVARSAGGPDALGPLAAVTDSLGDAWRCASAGVPCSEGLWFCEARGFVCNGEILYKSSSDTGCCAAIFRVTVEYRHDAFQLTSLEHGGDAG